MRLAADLAAAIERAPTAIAPGSMGSGFSGEGSGFATALPFLPGNTTTE